MTSKEQARALAIDCKIAWSLGKDGKVDRLIQAALDAAREEGRDEGFETGVTSRIGPDADAIRHHFAMQMADRMHEEHRTIFSLNNTEGNAVSHGLVRAAEILRAECHEWAPGAFGNSIRADARREVWEGIKAGIRDSGAIEIRGYDGPFIRESTVFAIVRSHCGGGDDGTLDGHDSGGVLVDD